MNRSPTLFICNKTSFKQAAKDFINQALSRAASDSAYGYWVDWLKERWEAAQADEENHGRRLHWMLGDISAARIEVLRRERPPLADGLRQLLLDCRIVTGELELKPAEAIVEEFALKQDSEISRAEPPGWQAVGQENISAFLPEFAQGYQLARQLRRKLVLKSHPIDDLPKTLKRLDVEIEERMHTPLFRAAVCASRDKRAHIIPSSLDPRMDGVLGERFAITSALGRLLWKARGPDERICVAQGDQAMLSQSRRANAFAAEFLLPREAVENMRPEDYNAIGKISQLHGVSRASVKWHAYNVAHGPDHFWR